VEVVGGVDREHIETLFLEHLIEVGILADGVVEFGLGFGGLDALGVEVAESDQLGAVAEFVALDECSPVAPETDDADAKLVH
jgi:hypothetical protein